MVSSVLNMRAVLAPYTSLRLWMLPLLFTYGLWVNPGTGDGGFPCLWRLILGAECPGCGLSRADALLVHGSILAGIAQNWLIIPVWLVGSYEFVREVSRIIYLYGGRHG